MKTSSFYNQGDILNKENTMNPNITHNEATANIISNEMQIEHSPEMNEIFSALSKAQGIMSGAVKDSTNPFFNSKYADLNSVWNACRDALSKNGMCVIQTTSSKNDKLYLITILGHSSGQWIKGIIEIKVKVPENEIDKYGKVKKVNELQLLGSYFTYLRRYSLAAMVGVAPDEDDDGNKGFKKESFSPPEAAICHEEPWKLEAKLLSKKKIEDALAAQTNRELVEEYLAFLVKRHDLTYKELIHKMINKPEEFNRNMADWEQKKGDEK